MSSRFDLPRRAFLRGTVGGASVACGLPLLEAMLNTSGTAHADGGPLARRFGVFFWANGKPWTMNGEPDLWTPTTTGRGFALPELLTPLAANRDYLNVVTGRQPHTTWTESPAGQSDGHMRGAACALTSDRCMPEGFDHPSHVFAFSRATIDQVVATHPAFYGAHPTRFRSLELGVSQVRFHDYGHWNCISHSGPNMLNLPILDVGALWGKLFGLPPDTAALAARSSVVDAVSEDAKLLSRRLGARDRERLDAHLGHLTEIQRRLESGAVLCTSPAQPPGFPNPTPSAQLPFKLAFMADVLAVALQCDLTRVFSIMYSSPATNEIYYEAGATTSMHQHCHDGVWEVVRKITHGHMGAFNVLLEKLKAYSDPLGGTLLDNTLVYGTSEYGEGYKHGVAEFPVLLAGGAGGGMKTGYHVREQGGNLSKVHTTILRGLNLPAESYGFNGAETRDDFHGAFVG